ncbi:hypothetical protein AJ78_05763 [Emergomyces pasteurianus Ep9510]|uniref:Uncharacterized protein n=1 Tax=Emergomyces pasteurianus Ep9510 TaxID=1447872 RepID=A0A1J9QF60_9EURO|nr:hypothetical protein AJ78_05763 [Emergomyces pasteurianus Ep9510]
MAKYPDEIFITYLNKDKTYTMSVLDTASMASGAQSLKYCIFIHKGHGSNEAHQSDEKLLAVEHMDLNQDKDEDIRPSQVQLKTSNFDEFSVI